MTHNWLRPPPTPRGRREGTTGAAWRMEKRRSSSSSSSSSQLLQFGDLPPIVLSDNKHHDHTDGIDNCHHNKKKNMMKMTQQVEFGGGQDQEASGYHDHLEGTIKEHEDRLRVGNRRRRRRKKRNNGSYKGTLKQRYEAGDPEVGLLGEASGRGDFEYYVLYSRPPKHDHQFCPNYLDVVPTGWGDI